MEISIFALNLIIIIKENFFFIQTAVAIVIKEFKIKKYAPRETVMVQKLIINSIACIMQNKKGKNWDESRQDAVSLPKMREKLQKPRLYRVFLLNDDYTPMDFVVFILENFFKKNFEEATRIMLNIHHNGVGECGAYSYEVAEMKIVQVRECARENEHPLQCVMEWK